MGFTMTGPYFALFVSVLSILAWTGLLARTLLALRKRRERRVSALIMPAVGLMASIGTLSSGLAYWAAMSPEFDISGEPLTLIASMGRGALLMGGIMAFVLLPPTDYGSKS